MTPVGKIKGITEVDMMKVNIYNFNLFDNRHYYAT